MPNKFKDLDLILRYDVYASSFWSDDDVTNVSTTPERELETVIISAKTPVKLMDVSQRSFIEKWMGSNSYLFEVSGANDGKVYCTNYTWLFTYNTPECLEMLDDYSKLKAEYKLLEKKKSDLHKKLSVKEIKWSEHV